MKPAEILKAAKEKIADPKNWCQFFSALDESDDSVRADDPAACRWCAIGALGAVSPDADVALLPLQRAALAALTPTGNDALFPVSHLNDTGTHADVMAMFDRAIALAEASS